MGQVELEEYSVSFYFVSKIRITEIVVRDLERVRQFYRRISQMTYQPKSVSKIADSEMLSLFISQNLSQMCT